MTGRYLIARCLRIEYAHWVDCLAVVRLLCQLRGDRLAACKLFLQDMEVLASILALLSSVHYHGFLRLSTSRIQLLVSRAIERKRCLRIGQFLATLLVFELLYDLANSLSLFNFGCRVGVTADIKHDLIIFLHNDDLASSLLGE